MDKRIKAMQHLEDAERELGKALSTLGGKTRNKPRVFPPPYKFIARQYIESLIVRLRVTQLILAERDGAPKLTLFTWADFDAWDGRNPEAQVVADKIRATLPPRRE